MSDALISPLAGVTSTLRTRASLQVEVLALRHQLAVLQRNTQRQTSLRAWDRILWIKIPTAEGQRVKWTSELAESRKAKAAVNNAPPSFSSD